MSEHTSEEGRQILEDVMELKRALERDYPVGPFGAWTTETGWIMSDPGESEQAFLQRIRREGKS